MLFSYLFFYITNKYSMNIYSIIFIVVSFIIYALLSKYFVFLIYDKALFKEELKNKEFTEDK